MWQKTLDSPVLAIACYCLFAFGITTIVAQDNSDEATESITNSAQQPPSPALPKQTEVAESIKAEQNIDGEPAEKSEKAIREGSDNESEEPSPKTELVSVNSIADAKLTETTYVGTSNQFTAPDWYDEKIDSKFVSKDGVVSLVFSEVGYGDKLRAESHELISENVAAYIDENLGDGASDYVKFKRDELVKLGVVTDELFVKGIDSVTKQEVDRERYYALLRFDNRFNEKAKQTWIAQRQSSRLMQIGLVSCGLLLVIGFLFGSLKLNSATSGFYQGRLQFLGGIVILGIIAAAAYFGLQLDWI